MDHAFASRLRAIRQERGLSQSRLGDLTRVGQKGISEYENGIHTPKMRVLIRLLTTLDINADWMLGLTTVMKPAGQQRAAIGSRIAELTYAYESRTEFARSIGRCEQAVYCWERTNGLSLDNLLHLCTTTGVSADWVLGLTNERMRPTCNS